MNTRGVDRIVDTKSELREKVDYIQKNPISGGLVPRADPWPWSS